MRLAVSNIAWPPPMEREAAALLADRGLDAVELAPTRVWPNLGEHHAPTPRSVRTFWESEGLSIVALQALLYGRPELTIFADEASRAATLDYLTHALDLAVDLGAGWLVFGSPKNRAIGARRPDEVAPIARDFFGRLGDRAAARGLVVGIEANPPEYGCDYLTRTIEAAEFVRQMATPGLGCHLDCGGMLMAQEPWLETIARASPVGYVHASAPGLAPLDGFASAYGEAAHALRAVAYDHIVSIEMRAVEAGPLEGVASAIEVARHAFLVGTTPTDIDS